MLSTARSSDGAAPLGAARVLNAIGSGRCDVTGIRTYLDLDLGLASRLLRSLVEEGLVVTEAQPHDARRRVAQLTEAGARESTAFLDRSPRVDDLPRTTDLISLALERDRIAVEEADARGEAARFCLGEYYAELARRSAQGFDVPLSRHPDAREMTRPRGDFLLAWCDGSPAGRVGLEVERSDDGDQAALDRTGRRRRRQAPDAGR